MCSTASGMASLLNVKDNNDEVQIAESNRRIVDLTRAVSRVEKLQQESSATYTSTGDWTGTYRYWDGWEDVEDLQAEVISEEGRLEALLDKNTNPMGHCHSHTEERKMFELPEEDKMAFCERHRLLGNFLYGEGVLPKAAEQYKTALSYYDYCFPEEGAEQQRLEEVRHAAQCNLSLCLRLMGFCAEAVDVASQAIRDSQDPRRSFPSQRLGKAFFRRAQAHRQLDDYDFALADLRAATELVGEEEALVVAREALAVQNMKRAYTDRSRAMAKKMLVAKQRGEECQTSKGTSNHSHDHSSNSHDHSSNSHDHSRNSDHRPCKHVAIQLSCLDANIPLEPGPVSCR